MYDFHHTKWFIRRLRAPSSVRTGKEQFASLDFLRVIASLMIILFHAHSIASKQASIQGEELFTAPIWWYSCIDLFFSMSGFLMIHMSRNLYGSPGGAKTFLIRRAIRTPPLYWLYTCVIAAVFLYMPSLSAEGPIDFRTFICSIFFVPNFRHPVIAIGWTLNYEIFFYTIIGLSILFPFPKGWKIAIGLIGLSVLTGAATHNYENPWNVWCDPLLLDFVIGIVVARIYYAGFSLKNTGTVLAAIAGAVLICCYPRLSNFDLLRPCTMGLGMGLILAAATLRSELISFGRWEAVVTFLSQQTYTMYLCHILVLKCFQIVFFRFFSGFGAEIAYIIVGTALTLAVAKFLYELIEKPLSTYLRRTTRKYISTNQV